LRASWRTRLTLARCSSGMPCEKLMRTTSTPASIIRVRVLASLEAGPSVATTLVLRIMRCPSLDVEAGRAPRSCRALLEHLDRRQLLALEEFEEGAAAGGNIGHPVGNLVLGHG